MPKPDKMKIYIYIYENRKRTCKLHILHLKDFDPNVSTNPQCIYSFGVSVPKKLEQPPY